MHFLSIEQYECLGKNNNPNIVFGCAGSGKTMVGIRKLIINNECMIKTAYITNSNMIVDKTKMMYSKFTNNNDYVYFFTFRNLCKNIIKLKDEKIINYQDFYEWIYINNLLKEENIKVTAREIWIEINSIIKGLISEYGTGNMLSKEEYFNCKKSSFDIKTKKIIYKISSMYNHWLINNKYYDDNDLAIMALEKIKDDNKFDYIIYDEVQELTNRQLLLISSITNNTNNIMLLGDINQNININRFNLDFIKDIFYKNNSILYENFITKNYRNGSETINWINQFKKIKNNKFRSMGKFLEQEEKSVKEGIKPRVLYNIKKEKEFFHTIDKDVNSIVIVVDESDKIELYKNGYKIGRVFSIEDTRGLEYNNVYCYNVLSKFNKIWSNMLSNNHKYDDIYSIYFNMVYIAVTRAKEKLCFIESRITKLDEALKGYWCLINDENIILDEVVRNSNLEQWLEEAKKLEKMEKYYQASEAYKKAGRLVDAQICLKANERKINYNNTEKYASFILISADKINKQILEEVLLSIRKRYDLYISGYLQISIDYEDISGGRIINKYIEDSANVKEIVDVIYQELDEEYISKRKVILKACFYKEGVPIDTTKMLEKSFSDLLVIYKNGKVKIQKEYFVELRAFAQISQATKNEYKNKIGFNFENQAMRLRNKSQYESKTADEMLDFIFQDKK